MRRWEQAGQDPIPPRRRLGQFALSAVSAQLHPLGGSTRARARAAFLEVAAPHLQLSSFKRLTAEEREDLEEMKTSRFEREAEEHEHKDHREHKAGAAADGDNGAVVPLPGFLTAVPGVSSVASSSYVLSAYEYAKENPMMTAWTVGTAAFSAAASAFRSVYDYFYPPQDEGWFGGWDAGLLSGGAVAAGGWFGSSASAAPSSSSWFGGGSAAASSDASASSGGWFGFGSAAPAAAGAGGAAGAAAGGWFGGLFGGSSGEDKGQASSSRSAGGAGGAGGGETAVSEGQEEGLFDLEGELDMDLGDGDDEGACEQQ